VDRGQASANCLLQAFVVGGLAGQFDFQPFLLALDDQDFVFGLLFNRLALTLKSSAFRTICFCNSVNCCW